MVSKKGFIGQAGRRLLPVVATGLALLFLGTAPPGWAREPQPAASPQPAPAAPEHRDRSLKLTEQGAAAIQARNFSGAYKLLAEAYRIYPNPETLYQLGALAAAEGHMIEAQDLMRRYLADANLDPKSSVNGEAQRIANLPRGSSGEVNVIGDRGALIFVDNRLAGILPLLQPLLLGSGTHSISLELGHRSMKRKIQVMNGRTVEMRCNLEAETELRTILPAALLLPNFKDVPEEARTALLSAVTQAMLSAHMTPYSAELALTQKPNLRGCLGKRDCQLQLAESSALEYVLLLDFRATGEPAQPNIEMAGTLLDTEIADVAAKSKSSSSGPIQQAAKALGGMLDTMLTQGSSRPRGMLEVASTPPGAEVRIADHVLGKTPLKHAVWAGSYEVRVDHPGYKTERLPATVTEGKSTVLTATLSAGQPDIEVKPQPMVTREIVRPRPLWRMIGGGAAIGLGVGLLGFGISALSVNGQCSPALTPPAELCRRSYDTLGAGASMVTIGALLTAGGAVLIALPGKRERISAPADSDSGLATGHGSF